jgi:hypothetical protein
VFSVQVGKDRTLGITPPRLREQKGGTMHVGDVVRLDGLKAEYSRFGKDRFSSCTLPDGNYVILAIEDSYVNLVWSDAFGTVVRKHQYRILKDKFSVKI